MQSILENKNPFVRPSNSAIPQQSTASLNQNTTQSSIGNTDNELDFSKLIENLYAVLLLALPFFFLPISADILSINKSFLVILVGFVSILLFFATAIKRKRLSSYGVGAYLGMVGLFLAAVFSTFTSANTNVSLFGHYGNYSDSLVYITALLLIGFTASNVKLNLNKLVWAFVIGTSLSTLVSFWGFYGLPLPGFGDMPRVFSFAGSIYTLFALQIVAVIASVYYITSGDGSSSKIPYVIALILNGFYLALGMDFLAMLILVVALGYLYIGQQNGFAQNKRILISGLIVISAWWFVHTYDQTRQVLNVESFVPQPRLALMESWLISAEAVRDYPFTGSGLGTFVNIFSLYRPASLNVTELWEARFETPFSDLFLWLATAGLIGVTAYAFFWVYSFKTVFAISESAHNHSRRLLISIVLVSFLSLLLLGNNPILYVLLFVSIGIAIQKSDRPVSTVNAPEMIAVVFAAIVVLFGYVFFVSANIYAAQYNFRNSLLSDNLAERYELQAMAVNFDQTESVYIRAYISTAVLIATEASNLPDLSDEDRNEIARILSEAVGNVNYLVSVDPINVSNWILRGDLYSLLMDVAPESAEFALESYNTAIELERTNPRLWVSIGSIYYRLEDYSTAISMLANAIQLKRDYANAYYNLAYVLKDAGFINDAVTQMEIVVRLVPEGTEDYERAMAGLEEFRALAEGAEDTGIQADLPVETDLDSVTRVQELEEPLTAPFEYEGIDEFEGLDGVIRGSEENDFAPASDGSNFDETQGERDAPIASPEE